MKVLNVAEKPSVAKEVVRILSQGRATRVRFHLPFRFFVASFLQRDGLNKFCACFDFDATLNGQHVEVRGQSFHWK